MILKKLIKNKYWLAVFFIFGVILSSRLLFLSADLPSTHVEIEEKLGGYAARNMIFLNRWPLYQNWYQPMVWAPVQGFLSYLSFRFFGVGLGQFRFPTALASFIGLIFFFIILLRQTNRTFAILGLLVYALSFEITVWNRSALIENLYLLFMPLAVYFLTKKSFGVKDIFFLVFFSALNVVVKLDGYPFFLTTIIFLFIWSLRTKSFLKNIKPIILGSMAAFMIFLALFAFFDAFKYFLPMYKFLFSIMARDSPLIQGMFFALRKLLAILLSIDPYVLLAFLISLPVWVINRKRFNRVDLFMLIFLFISIFTRLQIPMQYIYFKRTIFLYFPFIYIIFRSLFFLYSKSEALTVGKKTVIEIFIELTAPSFYCLSFLYFYIFYFSQSISRLYTYGEFSESFHKTSGSFIYLLLIIILSMGCLNGLIFFGQSRKLKKILLILILFFVFVSLGINGINVNKMFFPENIKFSYQENLKFAKMIPENEMIVGHEQGFRAFAYLAKNDFYFNHDGGANPIEYREVLERQDLRYFVTNIEEFWSGRWGISNQTRLEIIKQAYPDLKLLGVFFASKVPLAIYDKYGNR